MIDYKFNAAAGYTLNGEILGVAGPNYLNPYRLCVDRRSGNLIREDKTGAVVDIISNLRGDHLVLEYSGDLNLYNAAGHVIWTLPRINVPLASAPTPI